MAIAPDEKELLTEDSYDVVGTMVHEDADVAPDMTANEELWQEDTATSMDKKEHATEQQKRAEQGINYPVAGWLILLHAAMPRIPRHEWRRPAPDRETPDHGGLLPTARLEHPGNPSKTAYSLTWLDLSPGRQATPRSVK